MEKEVQIKKNPFLGGLWTFSGKSQFWIISPILTGFFHRGCGCYNSYTIDQKVDFTLHVHLYTGFIFTWTSLTTSWSSASAIALIFGLAVKLEKSEKQPKIFSIKERRGMRLSKVLKVLMIFQLLQYFYHIAGVAITCTCNFVTQRSPISEAWGNN